MRCPFCNQDNTRVVDSRPVEDTNSIRRRRLCDACGKRFTTYEKVETIPLTVIKKDQNRESYKRSNIIFTKADKLSKTQREKSVERFRTALAQQWEELPPMFVSSSEKAVGREEILENSRKILQRPPIVIQPRLGNKLFLQEIHRKNQPEKRGLKKALQKQQGLKLGLKFRHKAKQGERPTLRQNAF